MLMRLRRFTPRQPGSPRMKPASSITALPETKMTRTCFISLKGIQGEKLFRTIPPNPLSGSFWPTTSSRMSKPNSSSQFGLKKNETGKSVWKYTYSLVSHNLRMRKCAPTRRVDSDHCLFCGLVYVYSLRKSPRLHNKPDNRDSSILNQSLGS